MITQAVEGVLPFKYGSNISARIERMDRGGDKITWG
jgi:hypothetical protein